MATSTINGVTYKWTDPSNGQDTPAGVGNPTVVANAIPAPTPTPAVTVPKATAPANAQVSTYQILDVASMGKYQANQYTRQADGSVLLNAGVTPIAGTVKTITPAPAVIPKVEAAPVIKTEAPVVATPATDIKFIAALNKNTPEAIASKQSIINLSKKPFSSWNDTDKANWNYATGNSPYPKTATGGTTSIVNVPTVIPAEATTSAKNQTAEEIRAEAAKTAEADATGRFGQARNLTLETSNANTLHAFLTSQTAGGKTLISTITDADWFGLVNAMTYGGYSKEDIANTLYAKATGKTVPFDLTQPRDSQIKVEEKLPDGATGDGGVSDTPAAPEVATVTGNIDPVKLIETIQAGVDSINKLIEDERAAFDLSSAELGNQLGTVMPLIQGEQVYQEARKNVALQRLVDEKTALVESGNLQMKVYEYTKQLRDDQKEALASILDVYLQNGTPITDEMASQYSELTGVDATTIKDAFTVAATNYVKKQNTTQDMTMLQAGFNYVATPAERDNLKAKGYNIVELAGRTYAKAPTADKVDFGKIGTDEDGNDIMGFINTTTKVTTPVNASDSTSYFTDATGASWNVAGWALDDTAKAASMQAAADKIGLVTEDNIAQKVAQFTPGLTPEMVKTASATSGVTWEAIMAMALQESLGGTSNVAKKNNNYAGITFNNQEWIKDYNGTIGTARPAAEGGNYVKFATPQDGLNAMAALQATYGQVNPETTTSKKANDWATLINSGKAKLSDVPDKLKSKVAEAMASNPAKIDPATQTALTKNIDLVDKILTEDSLNAVVGSWSPQRKITTFFSSLGGGAQTAIADVQKLISNESLQALIAAKAGGATFGALSDREMDILSSSATSLASFAIKDNNGKVIGYDANQTEFRNELTRLKTSYQNLLNANGGSLPNDSLGLGI